MSPLEKLIMKKKEMGGSMNPLEQKAKLGNLTALRDEMSGMMKSELQPKGKVEMMAVGGDDEAGEPAESPAEESAEGDDQSADGDMAPGMDSGMAAGAEHGGELSADEIDMLQMLLTKLKSSKMGS